MKSRGWKGVDLASASDVTPTSVSRYLGGKAEPRAAELYRLAKALDVSMEWLLTGETGAEATTATVLREQSEEESLLTAARQAAERLAAKLNEAEVELSSLQKYLALRYR